MSNIKNLRVSEAAHQLTLDVYRTTSSFPQSERKGLTDQMRRASVSVGSNIAEGFSQGSPGVFRRHLRIALGSLGELNYQLLVARDLELVEAEGWRTLTEQCGRVRGMLVNLVGRLDRDLAGS